MLELWDFDLFCCCVTECFWLGYLYTGARAVCGERSARGQLYRSGELRRSDPVVSPSTTSRAWKILKDPSRHGTVNCLTAMGNASLCSLPFFPSPSLSLSLSPLLSSTLYFPV